MQVSDTTTEELDQPETRKIINGGGMERKLRAVSNFITLIPFRSSCQMLTNVSGNSKIMYLNVEKGKIKR